MFSARSSAFQSMSNISNRHAWSKVLVHDTPSLRGGGSGPPSYPYMKHFWNPPQGEAKRDNNPRERSFAQCVVFGQELFQRLMPRGLSDRGRLHILFHPFSPLGCLVSLTVLGVRRAWPNGAGCGPAIKSMTNTQTHTRMPHWSSVG